MNSPLTYDKRPDWGGKTLPPLYAKLYGITVFLLLCGYLWKFHHHNASAVCQIAMGLLVVAVGILLIFQFRKNDKASAILFWVILAQCIGQVVALFRY
jgi:uncharacterized membrane protein HdeD (DUF308 family)